MNLSEIKSVLTQRNLRPLRQLGQNFLHDTNLCNAIVTAAIAGIAPGTPLVEIGPGLGALTGPLLEQGWTVRALEKDHGLAAFLRERFADQSRFELHEGDALELLRQLQPPPEIVLGNLPYNISTPLLMSLLTLNPFPRRMLFTLQRETAERLTATPETKNYGAVSVVLQTWYEIRLVRYLSGQVFYPPPEVESAVVLLDQRPSPALPPAQREAFANVVRQGFSQRRKKLSNLLPTSEPRRAEALSGADWVRLFQDLRLQ